MLSCRGILQEIGLERSKVAWRRPGYYPDSIRQMRDAKRVRIRDHLCRPQSVDSGCCRCAMSIQPQDQERERVQSDVAPSD